jgi:hypothetical protein
VDQDLGRVASAKRIARRSSHLPEEQEIRVRILPGSKLFFGKTCIA